MSTAAGGPGSRLPARHTLQFVGGLLLAVALLGWGLPHFAQTSWREVWDIVRTISAGRSLSFLGLGILGLLCYTFTLTGSLPGLRNYRALIINVCGSAISNLVPAGGAVGLAATYAIGRSWGFTRRAVSTSIIVTGVWNTLARIALPLVAIVTLTVGRTQTPRIMRDAAVAAVISGCLIVALFVVILASEAAARRVGRALDRVLRPLTKRTRRTMSVDALVLDLRARISEVVRTGWLRMTFGLAGYFACYYVLFLVVMSTTGVNLHHGELFAAFAIGRLLSAVGVTPGGIGVTETGTAAALIAWGAVPAEAAAGVVLFSIFTQLMEIPLGALGWVAWTLTSKSPAPEETAETQATQTETAERAAPDGDATA